MVIILILEGAYREQEKFKRLFGVDGLSVLPLSTNFIDVNSERQPSNEYYRSLLVLPEQDGKPTPDQPTVREVRLGVTNNASKTIDDVEVRVQTIGFGQIDDEQTRRNVSLRRRKNTVTRVDHVVDMRLPHSRNGTTSASIGPRTAESFTLLTVVEKDLGFAGAQFEFKTRKLVDSLLAVAGEAFIGYPLIGHKVLRNNSIELRLLVTGRNVPPIHGQFALDLKADIRVRFAPLASIEQG